MSRGASENKSRVSGAKKLPERASDRGWKKFEKKAEVRDPRQLVLFCLVPSRKGQNRKTRNNERNVRGKRLQPVVAQKDHIPVSPGTEIYVRGLCFENMAKFDTELF